MKKIIFVSLFLFAFNLYSIGNVVLNNKFCTSLIHQSDDEWESLGSITAISEYGEKKSFGLFVRVIGGKEFYQARVYSGKIFTSLSVTRGKFTFKGKEYNAKFSYFKVTYYCNI